MYTNKQFVRALFCFLVLAAGFILKPCALQAQVRGNFQFRFGQAANNSGQTNQGGGLFASDKEKFQTAVLRGDNEKAAQYIKPEYVNDIIGKLPPLAHAAAYGNTPLVRLLIKNGASVKYKIGGQRSIAYFAAYCGHESTAEVLVRLGAGRMAEIAQAQAYHREQNRVAQQNQQNAVRNLQNGADTVFGRGASLENGQIIVSKDSPLYPFVPFQKDSE